MQITFLGTGPSHGVPVIGCNCTVCLSNKPKNIRYRASLLLSTETQNLLFDTAPELRLQMIENKVTRIDAVIFTHAHADHVHGFDDLRRFNEIQSETIPCYAGIETAKNIAKMYEYVFRGGDHYASTPQVSLEKISEAFWIYPLEIQPLPIYHGENLIFGYRVENFAYLTDCSYIPKATWEKLKNLEILVIGALRYRPHPNHYSVEQAVSIINQLKPKKAYLTHMTHNLDYYQLKNELPIHTFPAYDGLTVKL